MASSPVVGTRPGNPVRSVTRAQVMLGASYVVAICVLAASAYGVLADEPYRALPEATVFAAQGQDVISVLVAVGLVVVALIKIVTLFVALWAGPAYALATDGSVHLGPDAGPTLLLLAVSCWLVARWWHTLEEEPS